MSRKRNEENKGLPARWKKQHGAFYYRVPKGLEAKWEGKQMFRLGSTLPEAYREWAKRLEKIEKAKNIGGLLDRYSLEIVPTKSASSQTSNIKEIARLKAVFGHMELADFFPTHAYQYADRRGSVSRAKRELQVLSHAFTKAVEWGYINRHPFIGQVRIKGSTARTRYVEDWELNECLSLKSERKSGSILAIQAYIRIKLLTGLRQRDLLLLKEENLKEDGIDIIISKTKNRHIIAWSDELRAAIELARKSRPVISQFLFCNKKGQSYVNQEKGTAEGWSSMWQRFMKRVLAETKVKERFTEHDIRGKTGSDASSLAIASELLAHSTTSITNKHYRRKPKIVNPLR